MPGGVGTVLLSPARFCLEGVLLTAAVARLVLRPADRQARAAFAALNVRRAALNAATAAAVRRKDVDHAGAVPQSVYAELQGLYTQQLQMQHDIERQLGEKRVRAEPALRAAAVAVMYQLAVKLRKAELETFDLTVSLTDDAAGEMTDGPPTASRYAETDLGDARRLHAEVREKFLAPLTSPAMRRDRFARRVVWTASGRWREAFDRDSGITDIRQELAGYDSLIRSVDGLLRGSIAEYLSTLLDRRAADHADLDDAALVEWVRRVAADVSGGDYDAADENYPILVRRFLEIRARFNEVPTWWWSLGWRAHCATLHGWLLLFAAAGAGRDGRDRLAGKLRREAQDAYADAARLIEVLTSLGQGLRPLTTKIGMYGRQSKVAGFGSPPSREELNRSADALSARVNRDIIRG